MIENRLILFILESIIIQNYRDISEEFADDLNDFITYKFFENKELFNCIFDKDYLSNKIDNHLDIISFEEIVELIYKYQGFKNYIDIVDSVGKDIDYKINDLALIFNEYCIKMQNFYYLDESKRRILQ